MAVIFISLGGCQPETPGFETISPVRAADLVSKHRYDVNFVLLDVRTPAEYMRSHISKAVQINYYSKKSVDQLRHLDRTKTYLIYCRTGNRSWKTLRRIRGMGFRRVYNMAEGIKGWQARGFPVVTSM